MTISDYELHGVRTSSDVPQPRVQNNIPDPGLYDQVSFAQYQHWTDPDGWPLLSQTSLRALALSPAHYWAAISGAETTAPTPTPAMDFGTLCHAGILEPDAVQSRYVAEPADLLAGIRTAAGSRPKNPGATKEGRARRAAFASKHREKTVVSQTEYEKMLAMILSLRASPRAQQFMGGGGHAEWSAVWIDPPTQIWCRARLDFVQAGSRIVDLKTTRSARPADFQRSIATFAYYRQAAWYLDAAQANGLDVRRYAIVAVESEPPHGVAAAELSPQALGQGQRENRRLLQTLHACRVRDHWPSYDDPGLWDLPAWARDGCDDPPRPWPPEIATRDLSGAEQDSNRSTEPNGGAR